MENRFKNWLTTLIWIIGIFAFRWSLAEPFVVPSGSMEPTIQIGDHILANKLAYDLKFPFTHQVLAHLADPKRGDIIVFKDPRNPAIHLVKRLVGIPGDHIRVRDGYVEINGKTASISESLYQDPKHLEYNEWLGSTPHRVQRLTQMMKHGDQTFDVPPNQYFFLGDNRDNSADSRYWGFAECTSLEGRAEFILYSLDWTHFLPKLKVTRTANRLI